MHTKCAYTLKEHEPRTLFAFLVGNCEHFPSTCAHFIEKIRTLIKRTAKAHNNLMVVLLPNSSLLVFHLCLCSSLTPSSIQVWFFSDHLQRSTLAHLLKSFRVWAIPLKGEIRQPISWSNIFFWTFTANLLQPHSLCLFCCYGFWTLIVHSPLQIFKCIVTAVDAPM